MAGVRPRGTVTVIGVHLLASVLVRVVPAYQATRTRTQEPMIARIVTGDSADQSALQAASRLSRTREKRSGESHRRSYGQNPLHLCPPVFEESCVPRSNSRRSNIIRSFA